MHVEKAGSYYHLVLSDNETVIKLTSLKDCVEILNIIKNVEERNLKN